MKASSKAIENLVYKGPPRTKKFWITNKAYYRALALYSCFQWNYWQQKIGPSSGISFTSTRRTQLFKLTPEQKAAYRK